MAELGNDRAAEVAIDTRAEESGTPVITVSGELDISNAGSLERVVETMAKQHPQRLIFDLSGLRFMDSAGIAVLVGTTAKVEEVRLRDPTPVVRRVIELTGLTRVLPMEP